MQHVEHAMDGDSIHHCISIYFFFNQLNARSFGELNNNKASGFNSAIPCFLLLYAEIKFVTECEQQSGCVRGFLPFASPDRILI